MQRKWFLASDENSVLGVAVYTQLISKADSLRCGQWTGPVQNSVRGKRRQRGCQTGKHTLSWGKTTDCRMRNKGVKGARKYEVQWCAGGGVACCQEQIAWGTSLFTVSFQG